MKHANAAQVSVILQFGSNDVTLTVEDDGQGFDWQRSTAYPAGGHGLVSMRERVEIMNGAFEVDSEPGRGTTIQARVPMPVCESVEPTLLAAQETMR